MSVVCAIYITWVSLVTQQTEVPTVQKPGLLSRLWEKYVVHRHSMTLPSPNSLEHPVYCPDEKLTRQQVQMLNTSEDRRQIEDEWSRFWFTDRSSHVTPEASLTVQLESLRKQKTEIEQQEAKLIDALKKQYEADKVQLEESRHRLEEERKRLVKLGVLKEPAARPTTSVLPELEPSGFKIKVDVDFVWEVRVEPASGDKIFEPREEDFLILVASKRPESADPFSAFVFPAVVVVEQGEGLEEERKRLEKLGVLPKTPANVTPLDIWGGRRF